MFCLAPKEEEKKQAKLVTLPNILSGDLTAIIKETPYSSQKNVGKGKGTAKQL